jgi:hypothetical protein
MTGYIADLGRIWNATTDEQLAALCREYPGFHTYAALMEEAAETERQKPVTMIRTIAEWPRSRRQRQDQAGQAPAGIRSGDLKVSR